ncbi:transmembrane protein, putative (macronuclear) [Tetrahymena thermophila SB210]|uniref:Transmembrane protein, putative n=1 Tax=Tetrahymena thermophila (strain SB210) TaxID=312017 RepID=Q24GK2_TETTS|nr:transmembrane protein, putative [Tetrahymena thermophila SB210]EAS06869.2 transmembrane protein, putative [Tetrahymena thermophila SB210]|eukprot:XP_001027111.2 transmembrane protein, putative [Tetrahymena thermophila SB210]
MLQSKNIKYQILETKYLQGAVDCLNQVTNQPGAFNFDLGVNYPSQNDQTHFFYQYPDTFSTTIIALDTSKEDLVCGIFPGIDFCNYIQLLRKQSNNPLINQFNQIDLKLLEPLATLNFQKGEILMGINYGVRSQYEDQKIGQNLTKLFLINALGLGFSIAAGISYNPISFHIVSKNNAQLYSYLDLNKQDLSEELKKKFKKKDLFLLGIFLQKNIPHIKMPEIIKPNL